MASIDLLKIPKWICQGGRILRIVCGMIEWGIEIGVFWLDMLLDGGLLTKVFSRVIHGGAKVLADLGVGY